MQLLSEEEIEKTYQSALAILCNLGMQFPSKEAQRILKDAGARINDDNVVKIPTHLVEYAVAKAPKKEELTLYGRESENDIRFENHDPIIVAMTMVTHVIDPYTRERRLATKECLAIS